MVKIALVLVCLGAFFSLGKAQGYHALEIEVDGTDHKLLFGACFDEQAVGSTVHAFVSLEVSGMRKVSEETSCPVQSPNCVMDEVLSAALKAHDVNLSACRVGLDRAKSLPAVVAIAGDTKNKMCTTLSRVTIQCIVTRDNNSNAPRREP